MSPNVGKSCFFVFFFSALVSVQQYGSHQFLFLHHHHHHHHCHHSCTLKINIPVEVESSCKDFTQNKESVLLAKITPKITEFSKLTTTNKIIHIEISILQICREKARITIRGLFSHSGNCATEQNERGYHLL